MRASVLLKETITDGGGLCCFVALCPSTGGLWEQGSGERGKGRVRESEGVWLSSIA